MFQFLLTTFLRANYFIDNFAGVAFAHYSFLITDDFLNKFRGKRSSSISSFEFQRNDIQREEVVKEVLEIYSGDVPESYKDSINENSDESSV